MLNHFGRSKLLACLAAMADCLEVQEQQRDFYGLVKEAVRDYDKDGPKVTDVAWLDPVRAAIAKAPP